jgi:hypothetical protein
MLVNLLQIKKIVKTWASLGTLLDTILATRRQASKLMSSSGHTYLECHAIDLWKGDAEREDDRCHEDEPLDAVRHDVAKLTSGFSMMTQHFI